MGYISYTIRIFLLFLSINFWGATFFHNIHAQSELIIPGGDWRDTNGKLIAATEGGIIKVDDLYYLWGMDRSANNYAFVGVNMYSSPDLKSWTFVNQILKRTSHVDLDNDAVVERAKILHNKKTGQFIMWMHYEGHNAYSVAEVAYATCNTVSGNYTFKSHFRPLDIDSRDINVYQDDDGKGYLICTTKGNQNVSLFELDESYTGIVKEVYRGSASNDMECEGHAIIRTGGYYFWLMSWCTGWDFNDNHYFYSNSLAGPWKSGGNIAVSNTHTYESQVGFAVTVKGSDKTTYLYTGDRWSVNNFSMSRIVLLPIVIEGTKLSVKWHDQYNIDTKTGEWSPGAKVFSDGVYKITAKHSDMVLGTNGSAVQQQNFTGAENQLWRIQNIGASHYKILSVASSNVLDINGASKEAGAKVLQYEWNDGFNQKFQIIDCGNGYHRFVSVNTLGKAIEISNSAKNVGADAVLGNFAYKDNQLFQIAMIDEDIVSGQSYKIENRTSTKVIDVGSNEQIVQNASSMNTTQVWIIEDLYNGFFTIKQVGSTALDNGNSLQNGSTLVSANNTADYNQQWQIVKVENGWYKIINRMSGLAIDNKDGLSNDGNVIIQYTDSDNRNQQWRFVKTDPVNVNNTNRCKLTGNSNGFPAKCIIYDVHGRIIRRDVNMSNLSVIRQQISGGIYLIKKDDVRKSENVRVMMR